MPCESNGNFLLGSMLNIGTLVEQIRFDGRSPRLSPWDSDLAISTLQHQSQLLCFTTMR